MDVAYETQAPDSLDPRSSLLGGCRPGGPAVRRSDIGCVLLMIPKQGIMRYNMINLKVNRCFIKYM